MPDTGAPYELPYPAPGDAADVPYWMQQNAEAVAAALDGALPGASGSTVAKLWTGRVDAVFTGINYVLVAVDWSAAGFTVPPNPTGAPLDDGSNGQITCHFTSVTASGCTLVALGTVALSVTVPIALTVMGE